MKNKARDIPRGVIVPIITPCNIDDIFLLIDHIISGGVQVIFLFGTTGEALKVDFDLKKKLIPKVATHVGQRAQLVVGITCPRIEESIELMNLVHASGACASVIAPLIFNTECAPTIKTLLKSGTGNLLLYNYPAIAAGRFIPISFIESIQSEKRIIGIKDSSGDLTYFDQLLKYKSPTFRVYYGPESNLNIALERGCDGFVPGTGNAAPELAAAIWEKKESGPWDNWKAAKAEISSKDKHQYLFSLKQVLYEKGLISDPKLWE